MITTEPSLLDWSASSRLQTHLLTLDSRLGSPKSTTGLTWKTEVSWSLPYQGLSGNLRADRMGIVTPAVQVQTIRQLEKAGPLSMEVMVYVLALASRSIERVGKK